MFALVAAALAGKAPPALSEPIWVDLDPLQPRSCISMVPDAGRFKSKDAETWAQIRRELENREVMKAVSLSRDVKSHPAQRTVKAAAYILGDGQAIDLEPLVEKYPEDACLRVMAAAVALKGGDLVGVKRHVTLAYEKWPDNPDVAFLFALSGDSPTQRSERIKEMAAQFPDRVALQYSAARIAEQDGDLSTAVAGYRRVYELGFTEVERTLTKLALQTGDLDTYLRMAMTDDVPVTGPGFEGVEDYGAAFLDWLGLEGVGTPLTAVFDTTEGELRCDLDITNAPITVMNFVGLARGDQEWTRNGETMSTPLYEGTILHRVIPGFMVQGGDPEGTGRGGPGYRFADEPSPRTAFDRPGLLAMANSGPDTNGSQFFITEVPTPHLSGKHTIFGSCDGKSVAAVKKMARVATGEDNRPAEEIVVRSIRFE